MVRSYLARVTPYIRAGLWLGIVTVLVNAALSGLARTPALDWLPKTVAGTGFIEDNRERVARATEEYRGGRIRRTDHLGAVIGISNVRQGVELSPLSSVAGPEWHFLGLGGAGLGIFDVVRHADVLLTSDLRPDVVVLGFGLHQVVDSRPKAGAVNVGVVEYMRRGDVRNAVIGLRDSIWMYSRRQDVSLAVQSATLSGRAWIFKQFGVDLPEENTEPSSPWREMIKSDWPEHFSAATLEEERQFLAGLGIFDVHTYQNAPKATEALIDLISRFQRQGASVAILLMPEHSVLERGIPEDAFGLFQSRLRAAFPDETPDIMDFRRTIGDEGFVDLVHLNRSGSHDFSLALAQAMRASFTGSRPSQMAAVLVPTATDSTP